MSHEEKNTVLQILIGLFINGWIILTVRDLYASGALDGPDAFQIWANEMFWIIIWAIGMGIAFAILGTIIFAIVEAIITGEADQKFITDERDKMIADTGNKVTMFFTGIGFVTLIAGIKFGYDPIDCMIVLMFTYSLGSLAGEFTKFARYRMGI